DYPEGGRGWWVVIGCAIISAGTLGCDGREYMMQTEIWGVFDNEITRLSWGIFQAWHKDNLFPDVDDAVLSFLGSLPSIPFITGGCVCCFVSMLASTFCKTLWQFFLGQGVLAGIGLGLILPIVLSYPAQWFRRRRGLATGFVIAGCSLAGGATTLVAGQLLNRLALKWTLIIYACLYGILMVAGLCMLKSRAHPGLLLPDLTRPLRRVNKALFTDPVFWSLSLAIMFAVFGYLPPPFYMQQYTCSIIPDVSPVMALVPAAVMNFAAALGRTLVGHVADRVGACNAFIIAVGMAGVVQLLIWNFAYNYATIIVASISFGFFGGTFLSLTSVTATTLYGVNNLATLSGILTLFNTPGNAAGAPIGGAVLSGANNNWHALISYSGASQIVGAL
ncbi:hypothetical protein DACRYDRAFT_26748, partial [Dacryopinax primogenitus]